MASKYKRTISVVLVFMNILSYTNCQSVYPENSRQQKMPKLVSNLPGEHLLRGSSEKLDSERISPEMDVDQLKFDETFRKNKEEVPLSFVNNKDDIFDVSKDQERPNIGFFNAEDGKSVKVEDGDVVVDPMTGQTMIRHIHPSESTSEESDYLVHPSDVTLKNLQGFYVQDADNVSVLPTTETAENPDIINPLALGFDSEYEPEDSDYHNTFSPSPNLKEPDSVLEKSNQPPKIISAPDSANLKVDPHLFKKTQEPSENSKPRNGSIETKNPYADESVDENTDSLAESTESATTMNENSATETEQADTETVDVDNEESNVYKLRATTSGLGEPQAPAGQTNNKIYNVESITRGSIAKAETTTVVPSGAEAASEEEVGGVDARMGVDETLLAPSAAADKQRTPKVDKAPMGGRLEAILRPRIQLSKRDLLRSWLEDPWLRAPAALLVPLKASSLGRALAVWSEATAPEGLNLTDVLLVGYDANGIGWLSRHNLQTASGPKVVGDALQKLLFKYQSTMSDGSNAKGDAALHACAWAAKLVPYDSALFVVTDSAPSDARRLPAALRAVIDKRLKLYTIWTDPLYPSASSEQAVMELTKASRYTEGEFLDYHPAVTVKAPSDAGDIPLEQNSWRHAGYQSEDLPPRAARLDNGPERSETLLVRRVSGGGALGVPVEEGVQSLRVRIDGPVERAILYPPTSGQIDLFNATSVSGFAPGSHLDSTAPLDAVLVFPTPENGENVLTVLPPAEGERKVSATVGVWRLIARCAGCDFRVVVTARAPVRLDAATIDEDMLRLRVSGPVASVRETMLVDEYGNELAKLPFSHQPSTSEESMGAGLADGSELPTLVADVPLPPIKRTGQVYARAIGRDIYGTPFSRLAGPVFKAQESRTSRSASLEFPEERSAQQSSFAFPEANALTTERNQRLFFGTTNNDTSTVPASSSTSQITSQAGTLLTTVQIGLSSRLYGAPGDNLQLHFEVSNYRERSINFRFEASGNLRFLRGIRPTTQWINAGQTANVIVDVGITSSALIGARDLITFTATGLEQVAISAYVYVVNSELLLTDTWAPNVRHTFQGDCLGKQGDDCARHVWATTVYARDNDGGLLRLSSSPLGLRYESGFVSGTRAEVTATYRATCCAPRLLVNAVDVNGNANTYTVDISQYVPDAAIAAIVLGVLLLIALICLIAFLVYVCVRRRKESRQLPSYATPRRET